MYDSIQHFAQNNPAVFEKIFKEFLTDESITFGGLIKDIKSQTDALARRIIVEVLEQMDEAIKEGSHRKSNYHIIRRDEKTLLTTIGEITFNRTYYKNKKTGERVYLLDKAIGLSSNARKTEDVVERILEHASENSYRISGEDATFTDDVVTKQTVMNVMKEHELPDAAEMVKDQGKAKKQVKRLYINADEDHVSLQFHKEKGDLRRGKNGRKSNIFMPKLVYVYEDVALEGKSESRYRLVNRVCFTDKEVSEKPEALWERVMAYIDKVYDYDYLEQIYVIGDGASWIRGGVDVLGSKAKYVLDKFHLKKSMYQATCFIGEGAAAAREQIWDAIKENDQVWLKETFDGIRKLAKSDYAKKKVIDCRYYILNRWEAVRAHITETEENLSCSAEGLVSHIFSDRLSSRPLGWSREGANKMAQLRVYKANGGKVIDLISYKKEARRIEEREEAIERYEKRVKTKRAVYEYGLQGKIRNNDTGKSLFWGRLLNQVTGF